jgi:hypothetical protein
MSAMNHVGIDLPKREAQSFIPVSHSYPRPADVSINRHATGSADANLTGDIATDWRSGPELC